MNEQTLPLVNEQAELLTEIGAYLRKLRQHQGMTLEDIASATLIPVRTLAAIEDGNLERLPEPVYVQGFIRRYADAIGVDGTEFANAFPTNVALRPHKPSWRNRFDTQLRPVHLYVLYTLLVLGAVSGLSYLLNRSSNQVPSYATSTQAPNPVALQAMGELYGPPAPEQMPTQTASQLPKQLASNKPVSNKPVRVSLTVKGQQSWLRIMVDGETEFEGMLSQGAQRSWFGNEQVTVRAGDAGAVEVSFNESQPKPLGQPGDVQEKTFGKGESNLDSWGFEPNAQPLAMGDRGSRTHSW
jgi:cytoskeletal protein RodZ